MTDFHKCIQTNSFSDKMYSMSHLWHQMSSPISCPHQPSLSVALLISPFIQFLFQSPFCSFTTRPAMLLWLFAVVSLSLTPSSLPRSFTPASFPRLTCVFGCNWESTSLLWQVLLEKLELVSFWAFPSQCHLCSSIQLSIMLLLFSPFPFCTLPFCFPSPILVLTSLLHSYFVTDVILRSSPFPPFTAGSLLLIITALNIPPTVHLFLTPPPPPSGTLTTPALPPLPHPTPTPPTAPTLTHPPPPRIKEWNGRFLPSFHHFSHLRLSFWSSVVVMLPPTPSDSSSPQAPFSILIRRREGNFCDSPHLVMFQAILRGWR